SDLGKDSSWFEQFRTDWANADANFGDPANTKWAEIGGKAAYDMHALTDRLQWDFGNPVARFTEVWSSFFEDEWQDAINKLGSVPKDTAHFAWRLAVVAEHSQLRDPTCGGTLKTIVEWGVSWMAVPEGSIAVHQCSGTQTDPFYQFTESNNLSIDDMEAAT